jgi:hypothetical protein
VGTNGGLSMATGAVMIGIGKVQDDKQQSQDESDDAKHFHPAWCAADRSAVRLQVSL